MSIKAKRPQKHDGEDMLRRVLRVAEILCNEDGRDDVEGSSARVTFYLTPSVRLKLSLWAREDQRSLSNLTYRLISCAIVEEEQRRGHPFESTKTERKSL